MPTTGDEVGILKWVMGGLAVAGAAATKWVGRRLEGKVGKEVFKEFKVGNDVAHKSTQDILQHIREDNKAAHKEMIEAIKGKADKQGP